MVSDLGLLALRRPPRRGRTSLVAAIDAVADRGYYKIEDMEDCEAGGITPFVPKPDRSPARSSGHFTKSVVPVRRRNSNTYCCNGWPVYVWCPGCIGDMVVLSQTRDGIWVISYVNRQWQLAGPAIYAFQYLRPQVSRGRRLVHTATIEPSATMDRMAASPRCSARSDGPSSVSPSNIPSVRSSSGWASRFP